MVAAGRISGRPFCSRKMVQALLSQGAAVDLCDSHGTTALMYAINKNRPEVVEMLLHAGASIHLRDETGITALQMARVLEGLGDSLCVQAIKEHLQRLKSRLGPFGETRSSLQEAHDTCKATTVELAANTKAAVRVETVAAVATAGRAKATADAEATRRGEALLAEIEAEAEAEARAKALKKAKKKKKKTKGNVKGVGGVAGEGAAEEEDEGEGHAALATMTPEAKLELHAAAGEAQTMVALQRESPSIALASLTASRHDRLADAESSNGGESTCIVCFTHPKTHIAVPCGHLCACAICSQRLPDGCPYCRASVMMWMRAHRV